MCVWWHARYHQQTATTHNCLNITSIFDQINYQPTWSPLLNCARRQFIDGAFVLRIFIGGSDCSWGCSEDDCPQSEFPKGNCLWSECGMGNCLWSKCPVGDCLPPEDLSVATASTTIPKKEHLICMQIYKENTIVNYVSRSIMTVAHTVFHKLTEFHHLQVYI